MTVTVNNGLEIACGLKTLLPNVKIVFGGVHASVVPEDLLNNNFVDIIVRNEGEYTFLEVVQRIGSGEDLEDIKGTSLNIKGEILNNPNRSRIIDLDSLPFPSRDLLPLNAYKESYKPVLGFPPHIRQRTLMFSGWGCPFDCHYCAASTVWGSHRWVTRSANNILDEIKSVVNEFGIFGFEFVDELTTLPKERLFDFCEGIHKRRLNKIRWICSSTVKQLDYDTAMIMRKAGCSMVLMGVESGSPKIRKALNKRISNEEILYAFESARKAGLDTCACIMLGAPGENFDTWQQTINLTKRLKPGKIALNIVTPYPGTCI